MNAVSEIYQTRYTSCFSETEREGSVCRVGEATCGWMDEGALRNKKASNGKMIGESPLRRTFDDIVASQRKYIDIFVHIHIFTGCG